MTYKEAIKLIDDNRKALDKYVLHSDPAHLIIGTFVASENRDKAIEQRIFTECVQGHKNNEDLLFELNMISNDLIPFVVTQMKGEFISQPLASYLSIDSDGSETIPSE